MKKKILSLLYWSFLGITWCVFIGAVAGAFVPYVRPEAGWWNTFPLLGLALPVILMLCVGLILVWGVMRRRWVILPLLGLLANVSYLTAMIQVTLFQRRVEGPPDLTVATYNVFGFGQKGVRITVEHIAREMEERGVDILCMQESNGTGNYGLDSIAASFGYLPCRYPPQGVIGEGLTLFSRYPVLSAGVIRFPDTDNRSMWADVRVGNDTIRLFNNHLQTSGISRRRKELHEQHARGSVSGQTRVAVSIAESLRDNFVIRAEQADFVRRMIDTTRLPVIVCGDFNDTPASYTYRTMLGGLTDGFREAGSGYGDTFRQLRRLLRIDYIFYSDAFRAVRYYSPSLPWSDHDPVIVELRFVSVRE